MQQYFPLILLAVAAIALFVLPARQRKKVQAQQQTLRDSMAPGTPVMTTSGLHGTVVRKDEGTVDLEISPGVVVTFAQQAVLQVREPKVAPGSAVDLGKPTLDDSTPGDSTPGTDGRPADGSR
jgi:preprotein translocase subunit YajC